MRRHRRASGHNSRSGPRVSDARGGFGSRTKRAGASVGGRGAPGALRPRRSFEEGALLSKKNVSPSLRRAREGLLGACSPRMSRAGRGSCAGSPWTCFKWALMGFFVV